MKRGDRYRSGKESEDTESRQIYVYGGTWYS